jgi:hypothetical protein
MGLHMSRQLGDWLEGYIGFTKETESAALFHKWVGISMIASALRRKVHFYFGRIWVYPNLYVILVAEPGIARKTQAISFGEDILTEVTGITTSADAITPQALLEDLEQAADDAVMPDNTTFRHSSLSILSGEFESFLGQKRENSKMIVTLTDLFDCKSRPFKYRTKHAGTNIVPHPFLNLLAATTPESLASSLPSTAIGGGLTTRMIFIWAEDKEKKVPVPVLTKDMRDLKQLLIQDLTVIARIAGGYRFTKDSRAWWNKFYKAYNERDPGRICKDPAFHGWYSRKPMFMIKIGTILAASRHNERVIDIQDFERALVYLEEAEGSMSKTFTAVGRSDITADVDLVRTIIERYGAISEKKLLQMVWRDIDAKKFDNVISTLVRSGDTTRRYKGPKEEKGIWYFRRGEES